MIRHIDGRVVDPIAEFNALPQATRDALLFWISVVYVPAKTTSVRSSYGQKHDLERDSTIYVRSEEFAGAMIASGFVVGDVIPSLDGANYRFRCRPRFSRRSMTVEQRRTPQESMQHASEVDRTTFISLVQRVTARAEVTSC